MLFDCSSENIEKSLETDFGMTLETEHEVRK